MTRSVGNSADLEAEEGGIAVTLPLTPVVLAMYSSRVTSLLDYPRSEFRSIASRLYDVDAVAMPAHRRLYEAVATESTALVT